MHGSPAPIARALRIVIPGGSGHLGRLLSIYFQGHGHHVTVLTRSPFTAPWETVHWDGEHLGSWTEHLEGADACINLTGRRASCLFTARSRAEIRESRIHSTRLLGEVISGLAEPPRVWLNASSAAIYPSSPDRLMAEDAAGRPCANSMQGNGDCNFLMRTVQDSESAFFAAHTPHTRKVALRSAAVMSAASGGAFGFLLRLVRLSLGGAQGAGRQFVPWIHELDFARAVEFAMTGGDLEGAINLASPRPLPNRDFIEVLRESWGMPNGLPAPALIVEAAACLMHAEPELLLRSRRVVPSVLANAGFEFRFPEWPEAAGDLVDRWRLREA